MADARGYTDHEAATALTQVIGEARWDGVALAHGWLALQQGKSLEEAADVAFRRGVGTKREARELLTRCEREGFVALLKPRTRIGSAENPVTKLFPATVTEERFLELAAQLTKRRKSVNCEDDRETRHSLFDFAFVEGEAALPINVKTASTAFIRAAELVGLEPNDCIPIPVYKASGALEKVPSLLYVVSVDFTLISALDSLLPELFTANERVVWDLLNKHEGARLRTAEDAFVFATVRQYWSTIREAVKGNPFHAVSARKAIRVLQTKPKRTPGIGLRAWGTGANAEVNVHLSIREDTTPWEEVAARILGKGVADVVSAINRRKQEWVYDPEI